MDEKLIKFPNKPWNLDASARGKLSRVVRTAA
jgi:hypothetical protein